MGCDFWMDARREAPENLRKANERIRQLEAQVTKLEAELSEARRRAEVETIPNKLMSMLKEVQATCPESGLQEFALKVFNWIEDERHANNKPFFQVASQANYYCAEYSNDFHCEPSRITLGELFRLLNAAQKAQEAKQ